MKAAIQVKLVARNKGALLRMVGTVNATRITKSTLRTIWKQADEMRKAVQVQP
jgi:predicted transcriptional regulator